MPVKVHLNDEIWQLFPFMTNVQLPASAVIPVQPGDVLGSYFPGRSIIPPN